MKGGYKMFEITIRNLITGEYVIIGAKSCNDNALRAAGYDPMEWACEHIYDSFEERRVW